MSQIGFDSSVDIVAFLYSVFSFHLKDVLERHRIVILLNVIFYVYYIGI